jgi:hypothetical protein
MKSEETRLDADTLEDDLERLFRRLFETEIHNGSITLLVEWTQNRRLAGKSVSVQPRCSECAPLVGYAENGDEIVYLTIGQNTTLDVPIRGQRYTKLQGAEELIKLIQAVAGGRFEETLWIRKSEIVKSVGKIFMDERPPTEIKTSKLTNPFVSLEKKGCKYQPYHQ